MSTQQLSDASYYFQQTGSGAASLALAPQVGSLDSENADLNAAIRINAILQTTLDTPTIIQRFADELKTLVPFDSLSYRNLTRDIEITLGKPARHTCTYRLLVREESLGELTVTRKKKFSTRESVLAEYLLCGLVYPLRNGLMYQSALQAALRDPLTGTANRMAMDAALTREIHMARRHKTPFSLIVLDIDKFKSINDKYGHAVGDLALKSVADIVTKIIRGTDMLFRYGGEEFVVLLSNTTRKGTLLLAERIRQGIEQMAFRSGKGKIPVTVSLGVAALEPVDDNESLFDRADQALYRAKNEGRNCVRVAESELVIS